MKLTPAFMTQIRQGIMRMVLKHPHMLNWPKEHITEVYVQIHLMEFKPSVN